MLNVENLRQLYLFRFISDEKEVKREWIEDR